METEPGIVAEMDVFVTTPRWAGGIGLIARVMNADDAVLIAAAPDLLAVLKAVADDGVAMRGFHEQFRAEIHAVIQCRHKIKRNQGKKMLIEIDTDKLIAKALDHMEDEDDVRWSIGMAMQEMFWDKGWSDVQERLNQLFLKQVQENTYS
jgi:hypothetical protein